MEKKKGREDTTKNGSPTLCRRGIKALTNCTAFFLYAKTSQGRKSGGREGRRATFAGRGLFPLGQGKRKKKSVELDDGGFKERWLSLARKREKRFEKTPTSVASAR